MSALARDASAPFDYCVVTASTPVQARLYASLVQRRTACGMYPDSLKFRFYSDPPKGRIGSGGGTLTALNELLTEETGESAFGTNGFREEVVRSFFGSKRVLLLHAGGESRRLPCYVPEGKLFGPLSIPSGAGAKCPPVVLDLVLSLYFKYPWADGEVIMASGDVIVDFAVERLSQPEKPFVRGAICGFGKPAPLEQGSRHGVFSFAAAEEGGAQASTMVVKGFHQKSPVPVLEAECLVPGTTDKCALDVGIFSMNVDWCAAFFRFAAGPCGEGMTVISALQESQLYFDFYLEVVIASLPGQAKEAYLERMTANASEMPRPQLEAMYACLASLELRGALVADAAFLHFGTLREFPEASAESGKYGLLPFYTVPAAEPGPGAGGAVCGYVQRPDGVLLLNCSPGAVQVSREEGVASAESAWVEMCSNVTLTLSKDGFHMLVGVRDLSFPRPLPGGICLDSRCITALFPGQVVAVYSAKDSFKRAKSPGAVTYCGVPFPDWLAARGLTAADVWDGAEAEACTDLWSARLFYADAPAEALEGYWDADKFSKEAFLAASRFSIGQLNREDSALERDGLRTQFFAEICGKGSTA